MLSGSDCKLEDRPKPIPGYTDAVALVLRRGAQILYAKRGNETTGSGNWGFVGGKLDAGESIREAAERESLEEIGVSFLNPEIVTVSLTQDGNKKFRVFVVLADLAGDALIQPGEEGKLSDLLFLKYSEEPFPMFEPTKAYFNFVHQKLIEKFRSGSYLKN
ncbi:NUDIX hydrolase [bacterium]|nr:NUDIX hydrolase [bacterium]